MMALLVSHGIKTEKGAASKGMVPLSVSTPDLAPAMDILNSNGFPKDSFDSLGSVFEQKGLVSSPLEEKIRFIYGLSQTLSETLNHIDGVITARVHIVLPDSDALVKNPQKSTASVFLKTRADKDLSSKIPDIKQLVQASVENLQYDDVIVTLFKSDEDIRKIMSQNSYIDPDDKNIPVYKNGVFLISVFLIIILLSSAAIFVYVQIKNGKMKNFLSVGKQEISPENGP